jgi:hypothetical protein
MRLRTGFKYFRDSCQADAAGMQNATSSDVEPLFLQRPSSPGHLPINISAAPSLIQAKNVRWKNRVSYERGCQGHFSSSQERGAFFSLTHPAMLDNCTPPNLPRIITALRIHFHCTLSENQRRSKIQSKCLSTSVFVLTIVLSETFCLLLYWVI